MKSLIKVILQQLNQNPNSQAVQSSIVYKFKRGIATNNQVSSEQKRMQQSSLSAHTVNNNDGTIASRMLHSLIQDYNNTSSIPPSPRESTEYYRSNLVIKPQQSEHQAVYSQLREENQEVNLESYRSNLSMGSQSHLVELMVKKESQLKELENFIMKEIEEINENKERQSRIKQRIVSVRESMCEIRQSHYENELIVRGQLQEMKEQMINRFQEMVVFLLSEHKQTTQTYIIEIDRLKNQLTEKETIINDKSTLLVQNQSIIKNFQQQIAILRQRQLENIQIQKLKDLQLQKLKLQLQDLKQREQSSQNQQEISRQTHRKSLQIHIIENNDSQQHRQKPQQFKQRQPYHNKHIQSYYKENQRKHIITQQKQHLSLPTQQSNIHPQHHLEVSFSADNRDQQIVTTVLMNQPTLNSNSKECHLNMVQSFSQQERFNRQNTNSDKQLTGGFGGSSDDIRVRFQVETSSIQQKSSHQEEYQFDNGNNYNAQKTREQHGKNAQRTLQNERHYEKSLNHSQSQKSPRQESFIQSSQVHRMNTMSFSMNQGNDLSAINQLDVFSDNGFGQYHRNKQEGMSDYEQEQDQIDKERSSIVRSHGGAYSFKKGHVRLSTQNQHENSYNKEEQLPNSRSNQASNDINEERLIMIVKGEKVINKQQQQYQKIIQKSATLNNSHSKESLVNQSQSNISITTVPGTTVTVKNQQQPTIPKIASTSVINLQPVQQQSAASTKRTRSPHRYDYCRLYQEQEIKEIENINQVCNNILLTSGSNTKRQTSDIGSTKEGDKITASPLRNYSNSSMIGNEDIIKQRLSSLKKDVYPSFRNTPKQTTSIVNTSFTNTNSNSKRLQFMPNSHQKKNLTIQIPQSPNVNNNPYYKIENHVHQMSVQEFSPEKSQKYTDRKMLRTLSINNKSKQTTQTKQLSYNNNIKIREREIIDRSQLLGSQQKEPLSLQQNSNLKQNHNESLHDRKQYIRSKIEYIKRKNLNQTTNLNQTNNLYKDAMRNNNNSIYQDANLNKNRDISMNLTKNHYNVNEFIGGKSPRVISFLKSEQQQNTPSRYQLERPSAVNRSEMMTSNNNRSPGKRLQKQKQHQTQSYANNKVYENINNRGYDNPTTRSYQQLGQVKGYDFTEDKLQKQLRQQNRSTRSLFNNTSSPVLIKNNTKESKLSQNQQSNNNRTRLNDNNQNGERKSMKELAQQIGNNNNYKGNDIYQQLNSNKNTDRLKNQQLSERQQQLKSSIKHLQQQNDKKSSLKSSTSNNYYQPSLHVMNSSAMSPLKSSTRNNSLYLQGTQVKSSSKKPLNSNSSYNYNEEKYTQQNVYRNNPYINNERKGNNKTVSNNSSHWKDNNEEDNLRWYDPSKSVAGFRRF